MKRTIALILSTILLLTFFSGCSQSSGETTAAPIAHTIQVGFGRADFTPTESLPIGSSYYGEPKMSTGVINPLMATCVAFTDETGNTVLLFHMDLGGIQEPQIYARGIIAKKLGIPANQIMVTATHTHAVPRVIETNKAVLDWSASISDKMLEAAQAALVDRKPAQMYTASIQCENLNFIRHYLMSDGTYAGSNFGSFEGNEIIGHTEEPDKTLQLIKFIREGGKDVILANWQGHPHRIHSGSGTTFGSDIVGVMRDVLEDQLDCNFAYFSGASGNVNNNSRIASEQITKNYLEHGQALASYAVQAAANFQQQKIGKVQIIGENVKCTNKDGNSTLDVPLFAFSLGNVGFVTAPYEMFNSQGMAIKASSPFNFTFVCTYANGHNGYIPDKKTIDTYDSYEEKGSKYAPGTAEQLTAAHIAMLNELYKTRE